MGRKVAIYARVSTEHEAQISALENQIQYYDEYLDRFPELELYDRYIDEGLSATSYAKRPAYLRMVEDAKQGKFSLIVTREVSRFARNILDAIAQTRMLKEYGVEVRFVEDGISTMNDDDGELKLSLMAILAQNESKKISSRVKAGQAISFINGVPYGNGNILGYDRVGREMVINETQATTVRRMFDLALQGMGVRKIHFVLEQEGRKTATGLDKWQDSVILKTLRNPFYCGRVEYRKQYVPDYLKQKKVNNHGEVERVVVKGTHAPIVTEEEFEKVQKNLDDHSMTAGGKKRGKPPAQNIWVKKLRCAQCGCTLNRRVNYRSKTGEKSYMFQCYGQVRTGTVRTRLNKGLPTDGICTSKAFSEWKLEVQADFIFRRLLSNKQEIFDKAIEMVDTIITADTSSGEARRGIEEKLEQIDRLKHKAEVYADMCADGDISRELYKKKNAEIEEKLKALEGECETLRNKLSSSQDEEAKEKRLELLTDFLKIRAFQEDAPIPEAIIEEYVEAIFTDGNTFTWRLSPDVGTPDVLPLKLTGSRKNHTIETAKTASDVRSSTGSNTQLTWSPVFLGTFAVSKAYIKSAGKYYSHGIRVRVPESMTIRVELA